MEISIKINPAPFTIKQKMKALKRGGSGNLNNTYK